MKMRVCVDCDGLFGERLGKGHPFTRCESCRSKHRRQSQAKSVRESTCKDCGEQFSVTRRDETKVLRGPTRCDPCRAAKSRERQRSWREANPERARYLAEVHSAKRLADPDFRRKKREAMIRRAYGLTPEQMSELSAAQDDCCAICRKPPRGRANGRARSDHAPTLHVDHCHTTGKVRGLLCGNCNTMIGLAAEDPKFLLAAVEYLKREQRTCL